MFSAVLGVVLTASMGRGLAGVNLQGLPDQVSAFLRNPQAIASTEMVSQMRAKLPGPLQSVFDGALLQVRSVVSDSITTVFAVYLIAAVAGFLVVLLLKEIPLRKEMLKD